MNYILLVLSGVFIGLIVAVPIGPVNLICIRRTITFGPLNGFMAGLGAALGDGTFAIVIGFGLTAVRDWIEHHSSLIQIGGGLLLLIFGLYTYIADPLHGRAVEKSEVREPRRASLARTFASTFALTITNPATLFGFTALFAGVGGIAATATDGGRFDAALIVLGVLGGSTLWWFTLTTVIGVFHPRIDKTVMRIINHASGIAVCLFGLVVLGHVALKAMGVSLG